MILTFFFNHLNHHQAPVADELYLCLGDSFRFIETCESNDESKKGSNEDFTRRDYLVQAWKDEASKQIAVKLCLDSDVAIFGAGAFEYQLIRVKNTSRLTFEVSERWLKRGLASLLSPRLWRNQWYYHTLFYRKPVYKLCASGFAASDHYKMLSYKGKCFKWGYFTRVDSSPSLSGEVHTARPFSIMWCARFLKLKHPEMVIRLAETLKRNSYDFCVDMFGDGEEFIEIERLVASKGLSNFVHLRGRLPNNEILAEMRQHSIFLFTSDKKEGWGVVSNESMASGCLLVASDQIGSSPYLIKHRETGCIFKSCDLKSLETEVCWLMDHPTEMDQIRKKGTEYMRTYWSPQNAARSLIALSKSLINGEPSSISEGPCSIA